MKNAFYISSLMLFLIGCGNVNQPRQYAELECNCCNKAYINIDSAVICAMESEKLLLFAFVESELEENGKKAWDILGDPEIIKMAKKDYVLLVLRPTETETYAEQCPDELFERVKQLERSPSFIITNLGGYPLNHFDLTTDKNKAISFLQNGDKY